MNLWKNLDKITDQLQNSPVTVLMLDFDGTLAPIVKNPQATKLPGETKKLLIKLSKKQGFYLAIISGRSLKDLKKKVGLNSIIYGGNHGLEGEILKEKYCFSVPDKTFAALKVIRQQLHQITDQYTGVFIEDKRLVLSFHYRMAREKAPEVKLAVKEVLKPFIQDKVISITAGKMVFDICPKVDWNKGSFAKLIINKIRAQTKKSPLVIFIGDDTTDEDVFRVLKNGITVKVDKNRNSGAQYSLKDTNEVFIFLQWMLTLVSLTASS